MIFGLLVIGLACFVLGALAGAWVGFGTALEVSKAAMADVAREIQANPEYFREGQQVEQLVARSIVSAMGHEE